MKIISVQFFLWILLFVLPKLLRNSCFQNIHIESKSTFSTGSFKYLYKGELKRKNYTLLSGVSEAKVFKLLEDCKGRQFVLTQNAISNTKISFLQITRFLENRLYSGHRDIYILLFQRSFFMNTWRYITHALLCLSRLQSQSTAGTAHTPKPASTGFALQCCTYHSAEVEKKPVPGETDTTDKTPQPDVTYRQMSWWLAFSNASHITFCFRSAIEWVLELSFQKVTNRTYRKIPKEHICSSRCMKP